MFGLFKKSPMKALRKEHEALLTRAFQAQRNGDIRQYSELTAEAALVKEKIDAIENGSEQGA
ncbi:DUF6435 family protein [Halioglobus pacificus]|nr:DUF6435 family protein [Halioglobus pacificus]